MKGFDLKLNDSTFEGNSAFSGSIFKIIGI